MAQTESQQKSSCHFEISTPPKVTWTAFKTNEKVPVTGRFEEVQIRNNPSATGKQVDSIESLLRQTEFSVNAKSISTDNTPRDQTLITHFFSLIRSASGAGTGEILIRGSIKGIHLQAQRLTALLDLNGVKKEIVFTLQHKIEAVGLEVSPHTKAHQSKQGRKTTHKPKLGTPPIALSASSSMTPRQHSLSVDGTIDLLDFSLNRAHQSLNKACEELHKGSDGISRTWTEVQIQGELQIEEHCINS